MGWATKYLLAEGDNRQSSLCDEADGWVISGIAMCVWSCCDSFPAPHCLTSEHPNYYIHVQDIYLQSHGKSTICFDHDPIYIYIEREKNMLCIYVSYIYIIHNIYIYYTVLILIGDWQAMELIFHRALRVVAQVLAIIRSSRERMPGKTRPLQPSNSDPDNGDRRVGSSIDLCLWFSGRTGKSCKEAKEPHSKLGSVNGRQIITDLEPAR